MDDDHKTEVHSDPLSSRISPFQHREWLLWRMADGCSDRIVASARRMRRPVNEKAIASRLRSVLRRHAVLRMIFKSEEPFASLIPDVQIPLTVRHALPDESIAFAVSRFATEAAKVSFSMTEVPAVRAVLVHAGYGENQESAMIILAHPIIADEKSLALLLEEIDRKDIPDETDEAFLSWINQISSLDNKEMQDQKLAFHKHVLDGAAFQTDLPADKTRPPVFNNEGDVVEIEIPGTIQKALKASAMAESVNPEVIVIAALAGVLGRVTRQPDIVIGLETDLRPPGRESCIGPFENTTVLRVGLEETATGNRLIRQIHDSLAALEPHRDLPFEVLIDALQPVRDPSRTPIYQVHFAHRVHSDLDAWLPAFTGRVGADLELVFEERGPALVFCIGYRTDIYERDSIKHFLRNLVELIKALCDWPNEIAKRLPICPPQEQAWILATLGAQKEYPCETTIHGLVALAAATNPETIAVCSGEVRLSYGELNRRANQLAHRLRRLGVVRDMPVALCMERSEELIIALLAILKAGGAYVPIEPTNPKERIDFVLADSKAQIVLTEPALKEKVLEGSPQTLVIEPGGAAFASEPETDPEEVTDPQGLAYVIYTSGSTGWPKGVLIEHGNVVRLFESTADWFRFDKHDVWTMFHSAAFDFSVWEIWGALIYGGRLVVVPYLVSRSPDVFLELLVREKVTVLNQTPSAFRQLIQAESEADPRELALRLVIFGGEALEFESLRPWFERHGDQSPRLVNMYGITETCVHVTYRPISIMDLDSGGTSIIGLPIPDLSTYVVDEMLQLLPPGIPGELVVGGAGLARGYLERPELTAERFVPDPFSSKPGARLYRSGDLVRLLPTGELDYLGRIDQQLQIRGFRVETGEIEAVLRRSSLVRDVAVVPWQHSLQEAQLVAYVVSERSAGELREAVRASLPEYMVPAYFVAVPAIPMTANGKIDRKALPSPIAKRDEKNTVFVAPSDEFERVVSQVWCEVLGVEKVSTLESFFDVGGTSLGLVKVAGMLRKLLDREINVVSLFQYPTVSALAKYIAQKDRKPVSINGTRVDQDHSAEGDHEPIAIVGMAGRFQGADNIEALWDILENGKEAITFFEDKDLDPSLDPALISDPAYVKARGILEGAAFFDPDFFGMSPLEAEVTDPQQRVLLEIAWEALEHAGVDPSLFPGLIAVYAGVYNDTYYLNNVLTRPDILERVGEFQAMLSNEKDFVATRIAHRLDLKGPALSIHTACSTSLVAVAQAFYALRTHQCDLALAGAAAVTCPLKSGYLYQDGEMLSLDGHTRPFDERASGTVFSDGAAMVVLRRLSDAIDSGDTIYALIRGVATNNDGGQKMSFSAPAVEGQAKVISKALSDAGIRPEAISYIETHGTATPLGDPIEAEGLKQAFGEHTTGPYCALGSIKSNLGHLTAPSGAAGLIKTVLALNHEQIPATIGFSRLNPNISFDNSPFYIAAKLQPWKRQPGNPRLAGVSSFGVGGTNAHVVVEEAPPLTPDLPSRPQQLLMLSARTESALQAMTANLATHLEANPGLDLADVAFTLQNGRKLFNHRRTIVASGTTEALGRLRSLEARSVITGKAMAQAPAIVFLFPGQGAQYLDMGRELYDSEPVFRTEVDRCATILKHHLNLDLRNVLYPQGNKTADKETQINQTWLAQPAIFVVEYALARLWMSWGIKPSVLIGHSIGEYVAAVLAEAFTLEDALSLLSARARLMQALPSGSMLAVRMDAEKVAHLLPNGVSIAAVNSPMLCVVSGPTNLIHEFRQDLESKKIAAMVLHTSHAFHSAMMDPMLTEFSAAVRQIPNQPPKLPWVSTCTAGWMRPDDLADGEYWVRQVRQTVRFAEALDLVIGDGRNIMLEVGPGQTLSQLARQHAKKPANATVIASLGPVGEHGCDLSSMLVALGRLWIVGVSVDWAGFSATEKRRRIALPTYPFERRKFWIEPAKAETPFIKQATESASTHSCVKEVEMQPTTLNTAERPSRTGRLINELRELLKSYSGTDHSETPPSESFIDLGFDSLLLTQISKGVQKRFGVKVTFRQMLSDLCTLDSLAAYLDEKMPPETSPQTLPQAGPAPGAEIKSPVPAAYAAPLTSQSPIFQKVPEGSGMLGAVIQQQLSLMAQHLELLRQQGSSGEMVAAVTSIENIPAIAHKPVITAVNLEKQSHFGPFKAIEKGVAGGLTERQQAALDKLVARYNQRTAKSKALAQRHRVHFCDPRAAGNFRQLWKEMVYPIVCARSKGSRIWDIDGNEYIDVTMGFGANYLGHSPDFVMQALEAQMQLGVEIGPQSPIAGEVARMICEFTGLDRATFCNTGSEAVMAAFRVARTVTGRDKIVYFYGDYHGVFDEVLGRPALFDGVPGAMPIAPGIPHLANIMILEYGNPSSLDTIKQHADEIAGVIVEPVQARHPGLQPREFLQELRRLTHEREIALIFDEVITGFRIAPGGAQEYFGVKADLATYGKVIGGGMPIGVLAGSATYMDALDGGFWQYNDDSSPPTGVTFFAGTFVRHPLAMAAAYAVLKHLRAAGPSLQAQANRVTARFVDKANDFFRSKQLPMQLQKFSTTFYYDFHSDLKYAGLLFYYLRDRGVHIWEGRVGHLSIAHTDEDMDRVLQAFQESVEEMQAGGFLPETTSDIDDLGFPATDSSKVAGMDTSPMTEAQREIFFSVQMGDDANCSYNESTIITFNGELNVPVLERAFLHVLERHPALRSTFTADGEHQIFPPALMTMNLPMIDLTTLPEKTERELRFREMCALEMKTPFDLVQGPLLRLHLVRLSSEQHKLIFTAHHMVCDGWSFAVVISDLSELYSAFRTSRDAVLEPPMSFAEYARQMLQEQSSEKVQLAEEYWVGQFSAGAPTLELPVDHMRPALKSFAGAMEARVIDKERFVLLKKVSPKLGGTLFATVLSVFATLLHRLTGQDDLVIGVPAAGQAIIGHDELVGHCLNFLPIRLRILSEEPFVNFAKTVKAGVLDAYEHQDFTYGTLIKKLKLPRDTSRLPLVSVMFNIDKGGLDLLRFDGLEFDAATNAKQFVNFEIFFNLKQTENSLEVECEYNTDLFDRTTIQDWLESFEAMIEGVITSPQSKLAELPILGDTQRKRLLVEWNQYLRDYPKTASIHSLFEEQAKQYSIKVAVQCGDTSISYADLNHSADALASQLRKAGTKRGDLVGLFVERSIDMVIGVLGILKSGAAYVPMDPSFPAARLGFMVEDSQMPIIVTQKELSGQLPEHRAQVILMDSSPSKSERNPDLPLMTSGDDLAYVIYTSGSTGLPKGVQIEHRAVVNFLNSMRREPGLVPDDVLLSVTTLSFDIAGLELLLPLIAGATIVIARRETVIDGNLLRKELEQTSATVMQATPVTWRMLLEAGWTGSKTLKILIGGEAVPRDLVNNLAPRCASLWNMYGPTETTIWSTTCRLTAGEGPVSIGRPIDNTQVYVASPSLQLQPVGTPGELLIGGDGLARGYWNQPELTTEKFINDPFSGRTGSRLYRTGDLARWHSDGTLECLGRIDYQIKLRGFRIELGEIETALEQHADVKQAVISLREDSLGNTRLVAYYMPTTKSAVNESDLRRHLSAQLPDYMVPAIFIALDAFPLTPNGKVDRKALPKPELKAKPEARELVAPRNEREKLLVEIWEEVLGLERVGIYDNFFELGGDSLLCFRVANRAIQVGIPLTPRLFFQHRTIADIIKAVESSPQGVVEESKGPAITRVSREAHRRRVPPAQTGES